MPDVFRSGVYNLMPDTKPFFPSIPQRNIGIFVNEYGLLKGKTVILSPFANSANAIGRLPMELFEEIAERLKEKGYICVTNLDPVNKTPIKGTKGIIIGLADALTLVEYCGYVVGIRSGYLDFVSLSKCRIIAVYPDTCVLCEHYSMPAWGLSDNVYEFQFNGDFKKSADYIEFILQNKT